MATEKKAPAPKAKQTVTIKSLALIHIKRDNDLQMRDGLDEKHVEILSNLLKEEKEPEGRLPIVFSDGQQNWLADGYHRYEAHVRLGVKKMKCEVRQGSYDDAKLYAAEANSRHGKRLDEYGVKKAILTLLSHPFARWWTGGQMATHIGCSQQAVAQVYSSYPQVLVGMKDIPSNLSKETQSKIAKLLEEGGTPRIYLHPKTGKWTAIDVQVSSKASKSKKPKPGAEPEPQSGSSVEAPTPSADIPAAKTVEADVPIIVNWKTPEGYKPDAFDAAAMNLTPEKIQANTIGIELGDFLALAKHFEEEGMCSALDEDPTIAEKIADEYGVTETQVLDYAQFHGSTELDWGGPGWPILRHEYARKIREEAANPKPPESAPDEDFEEIKPVKKKDEPRDAKGRILHRPEIVEAFKSVADIRTVTKALDEVLRCATGFADRPGGRFIGKDGVKAHLTNAKTSLSQARPFVVCPIEAEPTKPDAHADPESCSHCRGVRWLTYRQYSNLPDNLKKLCKELGVKDGGKEEKGEDE